MREHRGCLEPAKLVGADAHVVGSCGGLGIHVVEERARGAPSFEVDAHPHDRVASGPRLLLVGGAVLRGVVARGVGAHAVGHRLDGTGALARARLVEGELRDGVAGEHVVAVDEGRGHAVAFGAPVERGARLGGDGHRDRPLVVLQEEHLGRAVGVREHHRLVHVALARGAVAVVDDDGGVTLGIAGAALAVEGEAHRVAGGVQGLRAEHEGVDVRVAVLRVGRVPAAVREPAHHADDVDRVDAAGGRHDVFAVAREDVVLRARRAHRADLRGLLAEGGRPEGELALALQVGGLPVERAHGHHVAVERLEVAVGERVDQGEVALRFGRRRERPVGGQNTHECRVVRRGHVSTVDPHVCAGLHDEHNGCLEPPSTRHNRGGSFWGCAGVSAGRRMLRRGRCAPAIRPRRSRCARRRRRRGAR